MDKLNNIFVATFSGEACLVAKKYGFGLELNDLCISANLEENKRDWVLNRMRGELEEADAANRRNIIHGPFTELTPAAIDEKAIELMRNRYRASLSICSELGIGDLVLHDGYIPLLYRKPWHRKKSIRFWKEFSEEIPEGFTVYIENVFDDEPDLLCDILDEINEDRDIYRICLDVGHAAAMIGTEDHQKDSTDEVVAWIERMGKRIGHFHLHNNDGTGDSHGDFTQGVLDPVEVLEGIERFCEPSVTMTIESSSAAPTAEFLFEYFGGK